MSKHYIAYYESPIGTIEIISTDTTICSIMFCDGKQAQLNEQQNLPKVIHDCYDELDHYFKGERREFTVPYVLNGTSFQQTVWNALITIPYGQTANYQDIAVAIDNRKAVRAVGSANGKNKLSIIVPCHRVIGSDGSLTGYAGGLWRKEWLLQHEQLHFIS
ncbi:methylated-DNA--[protein]-cysteine S-methyltransferase [Paenibacillus albiflavus]|uniref:Methylated-DNA--protein-cysteine methyltransferase n=1 Tax=Paenibacillus albiflavus TaxID=2545760 RepID=A0A4R4ERQ7_9BACL|nr:methylated-DNA--[protein]-cysteine S-methyltransferase [Paenibacillus albiflavus]TCZ81128.1 methylated-DNA--[protein]-cysteine S-methyltransferase [Paenibacillus albiflavus]